MRKPRVIYIIHTDDGFCEVRKKLDNVKVIARNILRAQGFTHELKENIEYVNQMNDDFLDGTCDTTKYVHFEIDSGKEDAPGNLYIWRKEL